MAHTTLLTHPLVLREVTVSAVTDVTPRLRRVTVTGDQLGEFTVGEDRMPAFINEAFDDHVKLVFASDGDLRAALPVQRARSIDWPPAPHRQGRDYTPSRWDAAALELDLDFVMHGEGPAASWAAAASPGDRLHFVGPKSSLVLPEQLDWVILAGDETAIPAILRFLNDRPTDAPVHVHLEIRHPSARLPVPVRDADTLTWVTTPERAPSRLPQSVIDADLPAGTGFVWAAGESRSLIELRRWLRHVKKVPTSHQNVTGYWAAEDTAARKALALLDPLPWLSVRAAVRLGLLEALAARARGCTDLARSLGVAEPALVALVGYLATIDVVVLDGGAPARVALGALGERLLDDEHILEELESDSVEGSVIDALLDLAPAMQAGRPAWALRQGRTLASAAGQDDAWFAELVAESATFAFVAESLGQLPAWQEARTVTAQGPGAAIVAGLPGPAVRLGGTASERAILAEQLPARAAAPESDAQGAPDLVLSALEIETRTDDEVTILLGELAEQASSAVVVDAFTATGPGGSRGAARDLTHLALTGAGRRTEPEIARLAATAGWQVTSTTALGWDFVAFTLRRR
ncbi:siderophore-interacting protein [Occultella kanbiaonis]|uniref:siderophore-interacting protein n=1 Tax=Occultella kanbiaonis TaxID=2675754 RepID=UPI0012B99D25|nr:siderophore-interacting protein [Occultella kanbiaonis]